MKNSILLLPHESLVQPLQPRGRGVGLLLDSPGSELVVAGAPGLQVTVRGRGEAGLLPGDHCTVLYCTVLYCTVLYFTVLYHDTHLLVLAVVYVGAEAVADAAAEPGAVHRGGGDAAQLRQRD